MIDRVSYISIRYSKANNKYLKYDPKQEFKHIYLDANNLYSYVMSKFLSRCGFPWIDNKEFNWNEYISNSSKGCVLKVALEYAKKSCELQNDYPFAPDKIEIKREILSSNQWKIADFL